MAEENLKNETEQEQKNLSVRSPLTLTLVALILGVLFEILFDGHPTGINFPIWAAACTLALIGMARTERIQPAKPEYLLSIPIIVLSVFSSIRLEPLTGFLSIFTTLLLFGVWIYAFRVGQVLHFRWTNFLAATIRTPLESLFGWGPVAGSAIRETIGARATRSKLASIFRGLLLALPVFLIFLGLLASADLVFGDLVENAFKWLDIDRLMQFMRRLLVVLFAAAFSLGAIVMALKERKEDIIDPEQKSSKPILGFIEASVILVMIDFLFAIFVGIQFAYLFGGEANITAAGYNYSEYARRGFSELTFLAVLSLGLIIALGRYTKRESISEKRWFYALSTGLVALMGVILASALKRLLLYEEAYGFTRLRTYTHVAIIWMGVLFVVFLLLLYRERLQRFAPAAAFGVLGFTLTLNLLNVDAFIVQQNVKRYSVSGEIDIVEESRWIDGGVIELDLRYLFSLSPDAIPSLVDFTDEAQGETRTWLLAKLSCERLRLDSRLESLNWPSLHLSLLQAQRSLDEIADLLDEFPVLYDGDQGLKWMVDVDGEYQRCYNWYHSWD
jgi:hypothetical protein